MPVNFATVGKEVEMIDVHQNLGFVKMFLRWRLRVIDNCCNSKQESGIYGIKNDIGTLFFLEEVKLYAMVYCRQVAPMA